MQKKSKILAFIITMMILNLAYADGIKLNPNAVVNQGLKTSFVKGVGKTIIDNNAKLEFTYCLVGQESTAGSDFCEGRATLFTYYQARDIGKQIGGGWRLPTFNELRDHAHAYHYSFARPNHKFNDRVVSKQDKAYSNSQGQVGNAAIWTSTGYTGQAQHWRVLTSENNDYTDDYSHDTYRPDNERDKVILVRNVK